MKIWLLSTNIGKFIKKYYLTMKNLQSNINNTEENKYKIKMLCGMDYAK